ncbi:MAG: tol-pal system protein YbgF [Rubrivivax sp.]
MKTPLARAWLPLALAALFAAGPARAGLFDDEEARKAIIDLRTRISQADEQARARSTDQGAAIAALQKANADLNQQLTQQLGVLQRSLLDLNNQLEAMRADIAKLRGSDEQLARDVAELQRRQKDASQALDDRLRKIEPVKVSVDGRDFLAEPDEKKAFDDALATLRSGDFDKAAVMLGSFQRRWPASGYADSVRFWLGNAQYGRRDYKEAIATFRAFVAGAPEHPRAPEAMLAMANTQAELKDVKGARKTIDDLVKTYPRSEAAQAGKERLASLK